MTKSVLAIIKLFKAALGGCRPLVLSTLEYFSSSTLEAEVGKSQVQGLPELPSELKISLGQSLFRFKPWFDRNGNFRVGSHPASLLSVHNKGRHISKFICNVKMCSCFFLWILELE